MTRVVSPTAFSSLRGCFGCLVGFLTILVVLRVDLDLGFLTQGVSSIAPM